MRTTLRIGIVSAAMSQDPREAVARSRQMGFAGGLFDAYSPHLSLPELSQSGRREFRQEVSGHGQQLLGVRADLAGKGVSLSTDCHRSLARRGRGLGASRAPSSALEWLWR